MKNSLSIMFMLLVNLFIYAQEETQEEPWLVEASENNSNFFKIRKKYDSFFKNELSDPKSTRILSNSKNVNVLLDTDYAKFRRWEWFQSHHVKSDGTFPNGFELKNEFEKAKQLDFDYKKLSNVSNKAVNSQWINISRTTNSGGYHGMGLAISAAFHPTNPNIFWVTTSGGGVWKTMNGGLSYVPLGDDLPFLGTGSIIVDGLNANTLYLCVGAFASSGATTNGIGVYKSTDGGVTWLPTGFTTSFDSQTKLNTIVQSPNDSQILLLATSSGLYRSNNSGINWTLLNSGNCTDVEFKLNDGNIAYAMIDRKLYKSSNSGASFNLLPSAPMVSNEGVAKIALTKANFDKILIWSYSSVWVSENNGANWSQKNRPNIPEDNGVAGIETMLLSPINSNTMYCGGLDYYKSVDNGNSWQKIGRWCCASATVEEVHADHRNSNYNPLTNEIFSYNDGGVDKYNETTNKWTRLSNGLVIQQYYSAASAATNANIIGVGSQDNGGALRQNSLNWINTNGGDAGTQAIDPNNSNICYSNYNPSPKIIRTLNGWSSSTEVSPNIANLQSWWTIPYTLDPSNSNKIYAGYHAVFRSNDKGDNWEKISPDFSNVGDYWNAIRTIAVAPSNPDYIFAGRARTFYYTSNAGSSWSNYTFTQADISDIVVNPTNPQIIWVTLSQFSAGNKVFKSTNGGASWTNMSNGLPNVASLTIVYQNGTNDMLYVGTDFGVYYRDASMNSWVKYGIELPATPVTDLHIHYGTGKLRASTFGRGVYEISIVNEVCASPSGIIIDPGSNSALITWNSIPLSNNYYIYYKKKSETNFIAGPNNLINTYAWLLNLDPSTEYDVDIWVSCSDGSFKSTSTSFITLNNSCAAPTGILGLPSNNSINLTWNAVVSSNFYYIYYKKSIDPNYILGPTNLTSPSAVLSNLTPNTIYNIDVWVACNDGTYKMTSVNYTTANILSVENKILEEENKPLVFPNPTNAAFTIRYFNSDEHNKLDVKLFNFLGKLVYEDEVIVNKGANDIVVNPSSISSGFYLIAVFDKFGKKLFTQKIQVRG